jgi:hypothetical protein
MWFWDHCGFRTTSTHLLPLPLGATVLPQLLELGEFGGLEHVLSSQPQRGDLQKPGVEPRFAAEPQVLGHELVDANGVTYCAIGNAVGVIKHGCLCS